MVELMRPDDLQKIMTDAQFAKAQEVMSKAKKQDEIDKELRDAFMQRELRADVRERLNAAVSRAAQLGNRELQVITFPSSYCNDGGRRIGNDEPDWPASLEGFAKRAYDYYEAELKPLGYTLRVMIIDYPGGMPGNIGMFLKW